MTAAFIGNRHEIEVYAGIFKEIISKDNSLKILGVLSSTLENTTNLAISLNVKAYLNVNDILKECDVIFVCYKDAMLKSFVSVLKSQRVRNKIFCCFSSGLTASDFGRGTANSYYSVSFPYAFRRSKEVDKGEIPVLFERIGKENKDFENVITSSFQNSVFCERKTSAICYMAQRILSVHIKLCLRLSRYLYKEAGIYHPKWFELTAISSVREETVYPDEYRLRGVNAFNFKEFLSYLKDTDHPDMAEYITHHEGLLLKEDEPTAEDIKKLLKKSKKCIK